MPGAWEIREQNKVMCAILHVDTTSIAWALGLRNLIVPGPVVVMAGMPFDHARNEAVKHLLNSDCQYIFYMDSDIILPRDAVLRLLAHNKPIVSALYCRRSPPVGVPVMMKPVGNWITNFPPGALLEVDVVGCGAVLIHRYVFEKFPHQRPEAGKTWFDWRVDCQGVLPKEKCLSEDFTFFMACKEKLGIPVFVDTSIQARHIGFGEATYGKFDACNATPVT